MDYLKFLPPEPLGVTEHEAVTLTPASHDPAAPTQTRLGAFSAEGSFLDGFRMLRGNAASPAEERPAIVEDRLTGTFIYGGVLQPHYGHLLLEGLARAWFLRRRPDLPILWHAANGKGFLLPWHREVFALLGIPEGRFRFILRPTIVERVVLPDPGFVVWRWLDPSHTRALGVFPFAGCPRRGQRVWLSRSRLRDGLAKIDGETEMEAYLAEAGWTIVHPETLPVWQQLAAMADAEEIAGFEGSAFHTLLLADNVHARVTLYRRSNDPLPLSHTMIASVKHLRQTVRELPLRHIEGDGRRRVVVLQDPAAAARAVEASCQTRSG